MPNFNDILEEQDDEIKKNLGFDTGEAVTYVGIIDDHSGSMGEHVDTMDLDSPLKKDLALSNFNEQLATLQRESEEGMETIVTVVEFDNELQCPYENIYVEEIEPLKNWWTGGMTRLYDAIAFGISRIKTQMDKDDRENKAALIIIETDGYENASSDYSGEEGRKRLKSLIKELEETGRWTFTFLGSGIDEKLAEGIGMAAGNLRSTKQGDVQDIMYSYSLQNIGTKTFMDNRKKGAFATKSFYVDPSDEGDDGGTLDGNTGGIDGKTKDEG